MPSTAPAPETMLAEMCACAHRLGMAFGREAEREVNWRRKLELVQLFNQCFFGVRVAIALKMRLTRPVAQPRAEARSTEVPAIRRPGAGALRSRLAGASALPMSTPPPRAGPAFSGLAPRGPRPRVATGPPVR